VADDTALAGSSATTTASPWSRSTTRRWTRVGVVGNPDITTGDDVCLTITAYGESAGGLIPTPIARVEVIDPATNTTLALRNGIFDAGLTQSLGGPYRYRTWQLGEFSAPIAATVQQEHRWVDDWTLQALSC
jgi:hypothetical protein